MRTADSAAVRGLGEPGVDGREHVEGDRIRLPVVEPDDRNRTVLLERDRHERGTYLWATQA